MPQTTHQRVRLLRDQKTLLDLAKTDLQDASSDTVMADRWIDEAIRSLESAKRRLATKVNPLQVRAFRRLELAMLPAGDIEVVAREIRDALRGQS